MIEGTKSNALTLEAVAFANRLVSPIVRSVDDNKVGIVKKLFRRSALAGEVSGGETEFRLTH